MEQPSAKVLTVCQEKGYEMGKHANSSCFFYNNFQCPGCKFIKDIVKVRESKVKIEVLDEWGFDDDRV